MIEPRDTGLPIEAVVDEVRSALDGRGLGVLTAEPGAGKTTVVPLRLIDEPWLDGTRIVMLEPRRLAARAAAARMASLLGESVGETIGVVTRDDRRVSRRTRIEVVTEGVLTRRIQRDPTLDGYGLVIFDEFHERSQQADLGLALLLDARRTLDLGVRVLVMSATIDAPRIAELLAPGDPAPTIACPGRTFEVETIWRPRNRRDRLEPAVVDAVRWVVGRSVAGDLLVFLPGMAEIRRVQSELVGIDPAIDVHALHGSLPLDEQDRAVAPAPAGRRKIVLSTDISETSLTVEGVTTVVDSGMARSPRFDPGSGLSRLATVSASRASADQRAGRAGRLGPGTAIRLWSKIEHGTRPAFSPAELTQVDLAPVRLELAAWGVSDPTSLPLLDPLPPKAWDEAGSVLRMLGALDGEGAITDRGRRLIELPVHPRLGSIVITGDEFGLGTLGCIVAALIDERDVLRGRPAELPSDLGLRVDLVTGHRSHGAASRRSISTVERRAADLARRSGCRDSPVRTDRLGLLVAAGFPDRIAQRRGSGRGRFRLRNGVGVSVAETDELAGEPFIVAVDVAGRKKDARARRAAAVDLDDLLQTVGFDTEVTERLVWDADRNDAVVRVERHLGALDLGVTTRRPPPSPEVTSLLLDHVRRTRLEALSWTSNARALQARIQFAKARQPEADWPDADDASLLASLEQWLEPFLPGATGRADLDVVSVAVALDALLGRDRRRRLDALLPTHVELPNGRRVEIDYSGEQATVSSRAQDFYGLNDHPTTLGDEPVTVELLSPAGRVIQRTADLPGFWAGSWAEVRKDMAGRYPKHDWPERPSS